MKHRTDVPIYKKAYEESRCKFTEAEECTYIEKVHSQEKGGFFIWRSEMKMLKEIIG